MAGNHEPVSTWAGPLSGLRVLALTLAGAYATQSCAGLGAEVLKVEPPNGGKFLHHARAAVLDRDVRLGCEPTQKVLAVVLLQVDDDRLLVAVQDKKVALSFPTNGGKFRVSSSSTPAKPIGKASPRALTVPTTHWTRTRI